MNLYIDIVLEIEGEDAPALENPVETKPQAL